MSNQTTWSHPDGSTMTTTVHGRIRTVRAEYADGYKARRDVGTALAMTKATTELGTKDGRSIGDWTTTEEAA